MYPIDRDLGEYYGDGATWTGGTVLFLVGLVLYAMLFYKISKLLSLSIADSRTLWRFMNIVPIGSFILFTILKGNFSFPGTIGLLAMSWFYYAMAGAGIDERAKEENRKNHLSEE